jgi:hypothetical protein
MRCATLYRSNYFVVTSIQNIATSGYAIFGVPSGYLGDKLFAIVRELATRFSTLSFDPHVSLSTTRLQGNPSDLAMTAAAAASQIHGQLAVTCTGLAHSDQYFRSIYVEVLKTPELQWGYEITEKTFGHEPGSYAPHISLLYGVLPPSTRDAILSELREQLTFPATFHLTSFWLYSLNGTADRWQKLRECSFATQ